MIEKITIENFKSIKHVELDCGRINVFIGEPNSGKSNILEAIVGLLSAIGFGGQLENFIRYERLSNLFYDEIIDKTISALINDNLKIDIEIRNDILEINFFYKEYKGFYINILAYSYRKGTGRKKEEWYWQKHYSLNEYSEKIQQFLRNFKFYRFTHKKEFPDKSAEFLLPPHGDNLVSILAHNKELRKLANNVVSKFGFKLVVKPRENKLEIQRELEEGVIVSFPYTILSDTLQRIIFYSAAVCTNKNSIIAMEEPEAHAFPYYTKYLAELIAQDKNDNQYFITTHNPYFLLSLLEKTPKDEIAVFITYYRDYQTKVKRLSDKEIQEVVNLDVDVFFNLDRFLEG